MPEKAEGKSIREELDAIKKDLEALGNKYYSTNKAPDKTERKSEVFKEEIKAIKSLKEVLEILEIKNRLAEGLQNKAEGKRGVVEADICLRIVDDAIHYLSLLSDVATKISSHFNPEEDDLEEIMNMFDAIELISKQAQLKIGAQWDEAEKFSIDGGCLK